MLSKITLENFKSFRERVEIDGTKTNYSYLPHNVADTGILKGLVFVGANASGKSNILEAIKLLLDMLFAERAIHLLLYVNGFGRQENSHSRFEIIYEFQIQGHSIAYALSYDDKNKSISETLRLDGKLMLERDGMKAKSYIFDAKGQSYGDGAVIENGLFLRTLFFNTQFHGQAVLLEWMRFLSSSLFYHQADKKLSIYSAQEEKNIYQYLEKNGVEQFNHFLQQHGFPQSIQYQKHDIKEDKEDLIFFKRSFDDGRFLTLPEVYESTGNRALLRILHLFFLALSRNSMLIIDEFSSCLHNDLEELLFKYFMRESKQSQLFLVTHSTNLLSNSILRPDQEYAVEYAGASSLIKRFSSAQPRLAQNIEKMYVSGVFGGLPYYREQSDETPS